MHKLRSIGWATAALSISDDSIKSSNGLNLAFGQFENASSHMKFLVYVHVSAKYVQICPDRTFDVIALTRFDL